MADDMEKNRQQSGQQTGNQSGQQNQRNQTGQTGQTGQTSQKKGVGQNEEEDNENLDRQRRAS